MAFPPLTYPHGTGAGQIGNQALIDVADTPSSTNGRFYGFGEDGTSAIANRAAYALSENTDRVYADSNVVLAGIEGFQAAHTRGAQGFQAKMGNQGFQGHQGAQGSFGTQGLLGAQGHSGYSVLTHWSPRSDTFYIPLSEAYQTIHSYTFTSSASTAEIYVVVNLIIGYEGTHADTTANVLIDASQVAVSTLMLNYGTVVMRYALAVTPNTSITISTQAKGTEHITNSTDHVLIYVQELSA